MPLQEVEEKHACSRTHIHNAQYMAKHILPGTFALIQKGQISEYLALKAIRAHGEKTDAALKKALGYARACGSDKITQKHIAQLATVGMQRGMGPKMAKLLAKIRDEKNFGRLRSSVQREVHQVLEDFRVNDAALSAQTKNPRRIL